MSEDGTFGGQTYTIPRSEVDGCPVQTDAVDVAPNEINIQTPVENEQVLTENNYVTLCQLIEIEAQHIKGSSTLCYKQAPH